MEEKLKELLYRKMEEDMRSGKPACILSRKDAKEIAAFLAKNGVIAPPIKIGNPVFTIVIDCDFPGDCYAKQTCKGNGCECEYRMCYIEEHAFSLEMLTETGQLEDGYFADYKEAAKRLEELH